MPVHHSPARRQSRHDPASAPPLRLVSWLLAGLVILTIGPAPPQIASTLSTEEAPAESALSAFLRGGSFIAVVRESGRPSDGDLVWRIDYRNVADWQSELIESSPGDLPVGHRVILSQGELTQVFPNTIPIDRYLSPDQLTKIGEAATWEHQVGAINRLVEAGALSPEEVAVSQRLEPGASMNPAPGLVGYGMPNDYALRNATARPRADGTIEVRSDDVILMISADGTPLRQRWRDGSGATLEFLEFSRTGWTSAN